MLPLSAAEPALVASAKQADAVIAALGNASTIQRFDDPATGLHTSLFYFCCHTLSETAQLGAALEAMQWNSFEVVYDTFGCNLDHDNKTVYLHGMPSNQTQLFHLVSNERKGKGVFPWQPAKRNRRPSRWCALAPFPLRRGG